jgi:hypothetical protein
MTTEAKNLNGQGDRVAIDGMIHQCLTLALKVAANAYPERNIIPPMTDWKRTGDPHVQLGHLEILRHVLREMAAGPLTGKKRTELL